MRFPQGLKPTLLFEALCRPATHPLGGFPGRALLQNLACSEFFNRFYAAFKADGQASRSFGFWNLRSG